MGTSVERVPIKIKRTPITILSKAGHKKHGGWHIFAKPNEDPPDWSIKPNERILWCPWCGEWRLFYKESEDRHHCYHCFAHTEEYYVRDENKIWWENVPLEQLRKLNIPRPTGRK